MDITVCYEFQNCKMISALL